MTKRTLRLAVAAFSIGLVAAGTAPALADDDHHRTHSGGGLLSGLLSGEASLLGGEGGLLGTGGLLGANGGLLPGLLGGHDSADGFVDGSAELLDGLSVLPETLTGPPVGGEHVGENARIGGGLLSGLLDVGSILGGLSGRF